MKRFLTTGMLLATALAAVACSDQKTALNTDQSMHISSVKWDELAAAPSAAVVANNNLIMMR